MLVMCVVFKFGISVLIVGIDCLYWFWLVDLMCDIVVVLVQGYEVVLVSSGVVMVGWEVFGFLLCECIFVEK